LLSATGENSWRWMLAVMGAPAFLFLITLFFVPESPRWLVQKGNKDKAFRVLERINGTEEARLEILNIENSLLNVEEGSYKEVFSKKMRPILFAGVFLAVFSQITGINSIMYYAPVIFKSLGNGVDSALIQTTIVGGINFLFTLIAIWLIDLWGRKPLLITGVIGMTVSLTVVAIAYFLNRLEGYLIFFFILVYIASFAASLGPATWVVVSEIFPNRMRSKAMSVAVVSLWTVNFVVTLLFPVVLNRLGGGVAFLIFDVMCVVLLLFVIFKLPETKGKSLEELEIQLLKK
jgi:SP family arabinose:H+ symporter-like MFS transporter